jgi:hypothetical protein
MITEIRYPAHESNFRAGRLDTVDRIVIHVTNGPEGPGGAPWVWFGMDHSPAEPTSAHLSVDPAGLVYRSVDDEDTAYHSGRYNSRSVGVEIVGVNGYDFPDSQLDKTAEVVARWADKYGLPVDRIHIIGHNEVPETDNEDPGLDFDWDDFMSRVRKFSDPGFDASKFAVVGLVVALIAGAFLIR